MINLINKKWFQIMGFWAMSSGALAAGKMPVSIGNMPEMMVNSSSSQFPTNGAYSQNYANGNRKMLGYFKNGQPDGVWTRWFDNGNKSQELHFVAGKLHGKGTMWYPDGKPLSEKYFENNIEKRT